MNQIVNVKQYDASGVLVADDQWPQSPFRVIDRNGPVFLPANGGGYGIPEGDLPLGWWGNRVKI